MQTFNPAVATPDAMVSSSVRSLTSAQHTEAIKLMSWTGCEPKTWLICCQRVAVKGKIHHRQPPTMDSFLFVKTTSLESLLDEACKVQSRRLDELATNDTRLANNIQDSLFDLSSSVMVKHQLSQTTETEVIMHFAAVGSETVSMQKFWQNALTVSSDHLRCNAHKSHQVLASDRLLGMTSQANNHGSGWVNDFVTEVLCLESQFKNKNWSGGP